MSKSGLRLSTVILYVRDVKRSRDFYVRKLGFRKTYGDEDYVSVKTPNGLLLGLHNSGEKSVKPKGSEYYFRVSDVDDWYQRLRSKGVRFSQKPKDQPWGERMATFRDPDGHELGLLGPLDKK